MIWNSCHPEKVHKSVREGIYGTARVATHGKEVPCVNWVFQRRTQSSFWFCGGVKNWIQSAHRSKHCLFLREKRTVFVQVNKLINLCIRYTHGKEVEGILFSPEWSKCWPMLWLEAKLDWGWFAPLYLLLYSYLGMTAISLCIFNCILLLWK